MFGLSLLFSGFKSKFGNLTFMFLGTMLLFISLILVFNGDTILSRFGFETKTNLKGEVVAAKKDLKAVLLANAELESSGKIQEVVNKITVEAVEEVYTEKVKVSARVETSKVQVREVTAPVIEKIKKENPAAGLTHVVSKADANKVSETVIVSIHSVYDDLFPPQPAT